MLSLTKKTKNSIITIIVQYERGTFFMSKVAVMTDSNSGITQSQAKELGILVVPMPFFVNGETFF